MCNKKTKRKNRYGEETLCWGWRRGKWLAGELGRQTGPQKLGLLERGEKVSGILVRVGQQSPMLDFFPLLSNENLSKSFQKIQVEVLDVRFEFFNLFRH